MLQSPNYIRALPTALAEKILERSKLKLCKYCETPLIAEGSFYQHPNGWQLPGIENPQWIFLTCPNCEHQFSLSRLGFPQGTKFE